MGAAAEKTSVVAKRLESEDERAAFIETEKKKLDKIAEHQAKIAGRKPTSAPAKGPAIELDMVGFLKKHPDREAIHEAIEEVKTLGYLYPIERVTLIQNIIQVIRQSNLVDGARNDFTLIKSTFTEVEESANTEASFQGHKSTWINNGTESKQIPVGEEMPEGWVLGRIVTERMKVHQKKLTAAAAIINRTSLGNARGSRWYTNGEGLNIQVRPGVKPPEGFILGRHFNIEQKKQLLKNLKGRQP